MKKVSIVIPAYNEEAFIGTLLDRIASVPTESVGFVKEVVVVDDGSRDATAAIASRFPGVKVIRQENRGKGAAVQLGIADCTGEYVLVQDADLEYDPRDYLVMLEPLRDRDAAVVYGSRVMGQLRRTGWVTLFPGKHPSQGLGSWLAGVLLSAWTCALYQRWISDTLTGYKVYPTSVIRGFRVETHGFETDHELTGKLIKGGLPIIEVPVLYQPRTRAEGKKIGLRDGFLAVWTLLYFRFRR